MRCRGTRKNMVSFLSGELDRGKAEALEKHCRACPDCREELDSLKSLFTAADSLKPEIEEAVASVDWEGFSERIAGDILGAGERIPPPRTDRMRSLFLRPALSPVLAGLLVGVLIGAMAMLVILRLPHRPGESADILVPQGFLERVELEMARRETIDYLEQSEYLLLDFVQSGSGKISTFWGSDLSVQRTQALLSKKKYINPQLDKYKMAKAKAICDQIELLFFELTQMRDELNQEELEMLRNYIEQKQILLKIKLVKKELEQSEV